MKKTNWNRYYSEPYKFSGFTKKVITRVLLRYLKKYFPGKKNIKVTEFGGGNSCFYEILQQEFRPMEYCVVDNNQVGLDELRKQVGERKNTRLIKQDILAPDLEMECDVVFSVGLIEHFSIENTRRAILSHFKVLKKGGILILGFPTPTFLYKITRKISELLGLWIFHDERPLKIGEILDTVNKHGQLLEKKIIWPIFLTQAMLVILKK